MQTQNQSNPGKERRSRHRSNVNLPIKANLSIPEDTIENKLYNGMAKNISTTGMMCVVYGIAQDTYHKMVGDKRVMQIHMNVPGYKDPLQLKGKVIWVDYHPNAIPNDYCNIGLAFEDYNPAENKQIIEMIHDVNKRPDTTY